MLLNSRYFKLRDAITRKTYKKVVDLTFFCDEGHISFKVTIVFHN